MITHGGLQHLLEAVPGLISDSQEFKNTKPRFHYNLTSKQHALLKRKETESKPCLENTQGVLCCTVC